MSAIRTNSKNGEQYVVIKVTVPINLKLRFKVLCARKELTMSEVLKNLIEQWIQADAPVSHFVTDFSSEDCENVKGYLPRALKVQFKVLCTQKQIKMRSVLYNLMAQWVYSGGSAVRK